MASAKSIGECMNWVRRDVGRIDILVNNAGIMVEEGDADPLEELEIIRETMQTNVYGPFLLSRLAIPIMKSRRYGRIVNLSSSMGSLAEMGGGYIRLQVVEGRHQRRDQSDRGRNRGNGNLVNSVDPAGCRQQWREGASVVSRRARRLPCGSRRFLTTAQRAVFSAIEKR